MASQVEIMNRAIVMLGEQAITSPSDDVKAARELSRIYDTTRKALLRGYRWGFAMKRQALAASATVPAFQFDYQYPAPSDFLRLDFVGDYFVGASLTDYRTTDESVYALASSASGLVIETSLPAPLNVRYIADITTTTHFDPLFVEAFAAKLAVDAAITLTNSGAKLDLVARAFAMAIGAAVTTSAIERPPVKLPDDEWMLARM